MSWEVEKHLGQEFHAIDSDSGMVVGKMVLWKMDQSSTMGGWDQSRLEALQFRPVETNSEMTIALLSNDSDDFSDVVINMVENEDNVEDRAKEKGSPIVEKQVMTPNLEADKLSLSNMFADPMEVNNVRTKLEVGRERQQLPSGPHHTIFPHQTFMSKVDERRSKQVITERSPNFWDLSLTLGNSKYREMASSPSEKKTPELLIEEVQKGLEEDYSTSDDDILIEDLGDVGDNDIEQQMIKNLKSAKVMLRRMNTHANSSQGHTVEQVLDVAKMSTDCVKCIFCQAVIRREDIGGHQVSSRCRQLRTPASYFPSLPHVIPSNVLSPLTPATPSVKCSSRKGKRGRSRKERWIFSTS